MDAQILLVEDDPSIQELTKLGLEAAGFVVRTADDGEAGLERFREQRPDAVVLDIMLPKLDGLEVCRKIRAESSVPVVMLTARNETIDIVVGLGAPLLAALPVTGSPSILFPIPATVKLGTRVYVQAVHFVAPNTLTATNGLEITVL